MKDLKSHLMKNAFTIKKEKLGRQDSNRLNLLLSKSGIEIGPGFGKQTT